ncbi:MAG TPA: PAS domain-containing protein, partial [Longimicrobium sp.]|nr:PAS domain-containing protein [Longimicrobium sp.]
MQATAPRNTVLEKADVLNENELDTLPVGMIQLDTSGKVLKFNQTESDLARVAKSDALGKSFFDDVAPCTKVQEFHGKFLDGVQNENLHTVFNYEFRFRDGRRKDVV